MAKDALSARHQAQDTDRANLGRCWTDTGLVFTTRTGRPAEHGTLRGPSPGSAAPTASGAPPPPAPALGIGCEMKYQVELRGLEPLTPCMQTEHAGQET